jgi:hypothetical protein
MRTPLIGCSGLQRHTEDMAKALAHGKRRGRQRLVAVECPTCTSWHVAVIKIGPWTRSTGKAMEPAEGRTPGCGSP